MIDDFPILSLYIGIKLLAGAVDGLVRGEAKVYLYFSSRKLS